MNRLLAALALCASACALREPRASGQSGQPCSTNDQCESSVCFLGECRSTAAALSLVHAEVHSADSRYGALQSSAIDLRRTPVADFTLQPLLTVSGRVTQLAVLFLTGVLVAIRYRIEVLREEQARRQQTAMLELAAE